MKCFYIFGVFLLGIFQTLNLHNYEYPCGAEEELLVWICKTVILLTSSQGEKTERIAEYVNEQLVML